MDRQTITADPPNTGVSVAALTGDSLSQDRMYVRCSFPVPDEAPTGFEVSVPGQDSRFVSADSLAAYPQVELDMVLECAGNGRTLMNPIPPGIPWKLGGVSPITVGGVRLVDVLGELPDSVVEVVFTGADSGPVESEGQIPYQFSISRELSTSTVPVLATHIGGDPLTPEHGAPVRLIVPGHYAMKSVKWLTRIEGVTTPFRGYFVERYRYLGDAAEPEGTPVAGIGIRSVIASPGVGETVPAGPLEVRGSAWSGSSSVTRVEVSADGGMTWQAADLTASGVGPWAPVRWVATVVVASGPLEIVARATDGQGGTQPLAPRWNAHGYANNVVHRIGVEAL